MPAIQVASGQPALEAMPAPLKQQVDGADKSQELWFAATVPSSLATDPDVAGVKAFRGHLDVGQGLSTSLTFLTDSAQVATAKAQEVTTWKAEASAKPEVQTFGLTNVVNGINAAASGNSVTVSATVDPTTWNQLLSTLASILEEELR